MKSNLENIDLIVFDSDGTLVDSAAAIARCVQEACRDIGLPVPTLERAQYIIGLGLHDALRYLLPDLPSAQYPSLTERYRHHFLAAEQDIPLFDGVDALLGQLSEIGYLLAVATGKTRAGLDRGLESTGIGRWFAASRCADECFSKPHPAMLDELMELLGTTADRTLMVGDTTHDLQMAANAGCRAVAVAGGAHAREELLALQPLACLDCITDLGPWLTKIIH
jgi:phosphoglycolate phosphatase